MSSFPTSVWSPPTITDARNATPDTHAQDHTDANDEIVAIETALGVSLANVEAAGTASAAVAAHVAALDPHTQYLTAAEGNAAYDAAGAASTAVAAHEAASDPHPQYLTSSEGNAAYDAAGAAASAVAAHEADTTNVHGIADTSALLDTADIGVSVQGYDGDLAAIAALTPTNDDIVQRKAGVWTNRTPAQLKTDLALTKSDVGLGSVDNTADTAKSIAGDVTGTLGASTVAKLQGRTLASTAPTSNQAVVWNSGSSQWEPATVTAADPPVVAILSRNFYR